MKKSRSERITGPKPEIPATFMEALRQAFQRPPGPGLSCPDPEMVIGCALEELNTTEQQQIQTHLLTCRDCLELFLDIRLALTEAESLPKERLMLNPKEVSLISQWIATIGQKIRRIWQPLINPRKLIPALATVSLVALVFLLGREEKSHVLPPPQPALEQEAAPTTPPHALSPPKSAPIQAFPTQPPSRGLPTTKKKVDTPTPVPEKSTTAFPDTMTESGIIHLELSQTSDPTGGFRLSFSADQDTFAYLLSHEDSGKIQVLFSGNLEGGKKFVYPQKDQGVKPGSNIDRATIYLIASKKPLVELDKIIPSLEATGGQQIQSLFPGATIRSLTVKFR